MLSHLASDIMQRNIIFAKETMTLKELIELFSKNMINWAPVKDEFDNLVGVVSITDIISIGNKNVIDDVEKYKEIMDSSMNISDNMLIKDIMTREIVYVEPNTKITKVAKILIDKHIHRVIVVEDSIPKGIISTTDIVKLVATFDEA